MTTLEIRLLGEFAIFNNAAPLTAIRAQRQQCLLAYLLLHRDAPVERHRLAYLFWPDSAEEQALANLRNLLHTLGKALPNGDHFVEANGSTVQWRTSSPYILDVEVLLTSLANAQSAQGVQQALDLYRGPLLPSCYDDWIVPERERLEQQVADLVQRYIDRWEKEAAYRDAIHFTQWLVRRDPREDLYRQIMRLHALSGDRAGVARTYKECQEVLKRELDVEPSRRTRQAYDKYIKMDSPADPETAVIPSSAPPVPVVPPVPIVPPPPDAPAGAAVVRPTASAEIGMPWQWIDAVAEAPTRDMDAAIRHQVLSDALQHPATEIPLAIACMAAIYLLLYHPVFLTLAPAMSGVAWVLIGVSAVVAVASFVWRYIINFDHVYAEKRREQQAKIEQARHAALDQLRADLETGFDETKRAEGHFVLRDLDLEYGQLREVIARHRETDPLALSFLPALVEQTYWQGLSVLQDALERARTTNSPRDLGLKEEIRDLEAKVRASEALGMPGEEKTRVALWQETLDADRERLEMVHTTNLRLSELFQQARRCETALHQTRVELAALKGDAWAANVDAVVKTLQRTMKQAQAVQEEMRRLGY